MNDPSPKEHSSQKSPSECQGSSREDEISHWDDSQLDGNSLLGRLLLPAEERQDYETFASPQSMGLLRWEAPQQPKVQTPLGLNLRSSHKCFGSSHWLLLGNHHCCHVSLISLEHRQPLR